MIRLRLISKIAIAAFSVILLLALAGFFVLRSGAFHRYVLGVMVSRAEQAAGSRVEIGDFTFHLSGLHLDLYRIVVHGTEPPKTAPLCRVQHIGVSLRVVSVLRREIALRSLTVDQPVIHLLVSADGRSNLPHPPASKHPGKPLNIFKTSIGHFTLDRGELDVNDRAIPLEASLRQVRANASFHSRSSEYRGAFGYRDGEIQFGQLRPVEHNLQLSFTAGPDGFRANPLVVSTAASRATLHAVLTNYSHPRIDGSYFIDLATADLARALDSSAIPAGAVSTEGALHYRWARNRSFIDSVSLAGTLTSAGMVATAAGSHIAITGVRSDYSLAAGVLRASHFEAGLLGGKARLALVARDLGANAHWTASGSVHSISIQDLRSIARRYRESRFPAAGALDASFDASWEGSMKRLKARSSADLNAVLGARGRKINLHGALHVAYDDQSGVLTVRGSDFRTAATEVALNGLIGRRSALAIDAHTSDLREVDSLVSELRTVESRTGQPAALFGLTGSAAFRGTVEGAIQSPRVQGQLQANGVSARGVPVRHVATQLAVSSSGIRFSNGTVEAAEGSATFAGSLALRNWSYTKSAPMSLELTAKRMSLAQIERIAGKSYPLSGTLAARIAVRGSLSHPEGNGSVQVTKGAAWNQPIQLTTIQFQGSGTSVRANAAVETNAGNADLHLTYNTATQAYTANGTANGIRLARLHALAHSRAPVSGVLSASVRGSGTLKSPEAEAVISIPVLRAGAQTITGVSARATVANRLATLAFDAKFVGASAQARGTIHLNGDYAAEINFRSGMIDAGPLLASYVGATASDLRCQLQLGGWVRGPIKDPRKLTASVEIPVLRLARGTMAIANVAPIKAAYTAGLLTVNPAELKGSGTDFRVAARVPLAPGAPLNASVNGTVDFHILQMMFPDWAAAGDIQIALKAGGTRAHPQFGGQVRLVNASLEPAAAPIGVQNLNATVSIANGRAEITQLTGQSGGGSVTATGSIAYQHGVAFSLGLNARNIRVRYPQGTREVLDGNLRFAGTLEASLLSGQVSIEDLSLTPAFDITTFVNQFNVVSVPSGGPETLSDRIRLRVAVKSARQLSLASSQIHLTGTANLMVEGTVADPVVVGRADLTGGEIFFNNHRFQVEHGVVAFVNPVATQPVVNVGVLTSIDQYTIRVSFVGPFDHLQTTYSSDPSLSPVDIVHLLLTGQPTEQPGAGIAQSVLSYGAGSAINTGVQKLTGISALTIDPQMGGNGTNAGARISVQQRVTRKLFFTFSVDTSTTQDSIIQVEYQLNRRWSVQAMRNPDGGYSLEIRSRKAF